MLLLFAAACTFVTDEEWATRKSTCDIEGYFLDLDGDGFGTQRVRDCEELEGAVAVGNDCNDTDPTIFPTATETWYDGVDQDCAEDSDFDQDGDGVDSERGGGEDCVDDVADALPFLEGDCSEPQGELPPEAIHPGAEDSPYDGIDANCSGGTDFDADGDGYAQCDECDDADPERFPGSGAEEIWYDGIDQDCDGNDGDADEDGYVVEGYPYEPAPGQLTGDCSDGDPDAYPGATDVWYDGVDSDCAGNDDNDQDGDGAASDAHGGGDCDDLDATRNPAVPEDCGTVDDENCDGDLNDPDGVGCVTFYEDQDRDGAGGTTSQCLCVAEAPFDALSMSDCNDGDGAVTTYTWYTDADGDGYGDAAATTSACTAPAGTVANATDCDDGAGSVYPGAPESCDAVDSDCDGEVNDAEVLSACTGTWYADADGDGYAGTGACLCAADATYFSSTADDCEDDSSITYPGSAEVCLDGHDGGCDGDPGAACLSGTMPRTLSDWTWTGSTAYDYVGYYLRAAGDLDGDGLDELIAGAPYFDNGTGNDGMVAVLDPRTDAGLGLDEARFVVASDASIDNLGAGLASPGDVDGDGSPDLLLSSDDSLAGSQRGVLMRFGSVSAGTVAASDADLLLWGADGDDYLGSAVVGLGDPDGDGVQDLAVSGQFDGYGGSNAGTIWVIAGTLTGTQTISTALGSASWGENYADVAGATMLAHDLTGDGLMDLAACAPGWDGAVGSDGAVYVLEGPVTGVGSLSNADARIHGDPSANSICGSTPSAGDLDGDGAAELILVGAGNPATVWLPEAPFSGDSVVGSAVYIQPTTARTPSGATTVGDFNQDGQDDLVTGATSYLGAGGAFLFLGPITTIVDHDDADVVIEGGSAGELFGAAVQAVGDADGDGFPELAVGGYLSGDGAYYGGAIWMFRGGGY